MKRNKYINSFDTTGEFNDYIMSDEPSFPNVALTQDNQKVHYSKNAPNDNDMSEELLDASQNNLL